MANYILITDAEVDPEAPITSYLGYRWRDNLIAVAERASGAPRVKVPTIENLTGSGNWTVPAGVTRVWVVCIGGGGGGGFGGERGGGGGGFAFGFLDVVPGTNIAYVRGLGGTSGGAASPDGDGKDSIFDSAPIAGGPITGHGGGAGEGSPGSNGGAVSGGIIRAPGMSGGLTGVHGAGLHGGVSLLNLDRSNTQGQLYGGGGGEINAGGIGAVILMY